jgi:hypothetical protein
VTGQPTLLKAGASSGDYIWHDHNGWHLRVTHPGHQRVVFTGVITSPRPIHFERVQDERNDTIALADGGTRLTFRFVNYGYLDGADFVDSCAATTFRLADAGTLLTPNHIYLGTHAARPSNNPFTIRHD